jgi:dihydrofolate reductase
MLASLDGYVADEKGDFSWAAPDEEVHAFVNDMSRDVRTMLMGRRMYEVLSVWETWDVAGEPAVIADFQTIWKAADKVVFSGSSPAITTPRTTLETTFAPDDIRGRKARAEHDLSIGGPMLAAQALAAGLVDEIQLYLMPVVVGGGLRALPDDLRLSLELIDERRFANGAVMVRYAVRD